MNYDTQIPPYLQYCNINYVVTQEPCLQGLADQNKELH